MKKKTLMTILCICLIVTASVMATLAYLTDRDSVTNTFTVGDVQIKLDETVVNTNGEPVDKEGNPLKPGQTPIREEEGNEYHLIPGQTYVKDPMITVKKGSEESYVRMMVTINCIKELDAIFAPDGAKLISIFNGYKENIWVYETETRNAADNTITYEFRYAKPVKAGKDSAVVMEPLFESITVPGQLTKEQLKTIEDLEIVVEGHAIQTATFADEDAAWAAFEKQWKK